MVPLASPCAKYGSVEGSYVSSHMLSLSSPFLQNAFCPPSNAVKRSLPFSLRTDDKELQHWLESAKKSEGRKANFVDRHPGAEAPPDESPSHQKEECEKCPIGERQSADDGRELSCRHDPSIQMNGANDTRMTGSSNPRADQLNWLADVATGAARGPQSSSPTVVDGGEKGVVSRPPPHLQGADPLPGRTAYGSVLLGVSPMSQRMYSSQYHLEHLQPSSPTAGSGLSLYYSQAPRSYAGFYPADHRLQYCAAIPDGLVGNRLSRPYFQGDGLYHPAMTAMSTVQLQNNRNQLPHSPGYLHQTASLSPVGSAAGSPSSPHSRLSSAHAAISLLQSRSPEEMLPQEKGHMPLPVTRNSPQFQHPDDKRTSYNSSLESKTHSPVGERTMTSSSSPYVAQEPQSSSSSSKDLSVRQSSSPSHVHYKVPTGKEGSLKHRILRPPSINIVDTPSVVQDAPLSAPPIRSTSSSHHGEPSPKHMRVDGYAGYHRSFSTSSSFALDGAAVAQSVPQVSPHSSPSFTSTCTLPSATALGAVGAVGVHAQNSQLKYPPAFMKGSIIQLANSQLKPVEQMTTEDFMECEALSPNLKIDSSTVISIEKMPASGSAKLGFAVGEKKLQITVEAPLEHPFFVYKQGWSSCCPERSFLRYGLNCNKLKVGDTCIFLTVKSELPSTSSQNSTHSPKPPTLVPTASSAAEASTSESSNPSEEQRHRAQQPISKSSATAAASSSSARPETATTQLAALQSKMSALSTESSNLVEGTPPPKRKRRWSFPDRISACSPPSS